MKPSFLNALIVCLSTAALAQSPLAVINGARFETRYPVSAGSYAQAYGTLTGVPNTQATSVPLPTELAGVRVLVNDVPAPLYNINSQSVSFIVPIATAAGRQPVRVLRGGSTLAEGAADVVPVSPGIFFALADPLAQGGVLNQSLEYAVQSNPARRGQGIAIFGTGQGPVSQAVPDGAAPPAGTLVTARGTTKVYVSVDEAQVTFSGLSPDFPGLWQINAVVPDRPYITGRVPLIVTLDGVPANQVSFWVAE